MACKILFDICSDKQKRMINSKLTVFSLCYPIHKGKTSNQETRIKLLGGNNLSAETSYLSYSNCSVVIGMNKLESP